MDINILPGGMLSDVVENKIGASKHLEVYNLRQNKEGEWESIEGWRYLKQSAGSEIISAIEVSDDLSGDRFILYQDGTTLKRLDYNSGYESETAQTLSLPTGITISDKLKFFYYRGNIRITGAKEGENYCQLWYGYIDRTIFVGAWETVYLENFSNSMNGWNGINAGVALYDCDSDAAGAGVIAAPYGTYAMQVAQSMYSGYAYIKISVVANKKYRLALLSFRKSSSNGSLLIKIGSLADDDDYKRIECDTNNRWVLHDEEITPTTDNLYITIKPRKDTSLETAYIDYVFLERSAEIEIKDWVLEKTNIEPQNFVLNDTEIRGAEDDDAERYLFGKSFSGYDKSQYSLQKAMNEDGTYKETGLNSELYVLDKKYISIETLLSGTDLRENIKFKRLSSLGISLATCETITNLVQDKDLTFYTDEEFVLDEELDDFSYLAPAWYYNGSDKNRIYIGNYDPGGGTVYSGLGDHYLFEGARLTISNGATSADVLITEIGVTALDEWYIEISCPIDLLFRDLISITYHDDFETGLDGWSGFFATPTQYDNAVDPDGIGSAPSGTHCLKVVQGFTAGTVEKTYTVTPGAYVRVRAKCFVKSGTSGVMHLYIDPGLAYPSPVDISMTGEGSWQTVDQTVKVYDTDLKLLFMPADTAKVTGWIDDVHVDVETDTTFEGVSAKVERKWIYDSNGYKITKGIDRTLLTSEFFDYVNIPAGTKEIAPQYSHWTVVNQRAYCLSLENEESDILRYSPENQFDVFPSGNVMSNDVGDSDSNKVLLNRDSKITVLKTKSISQWNYSGSSFYRDIAFAKNGIYSIDGYIVINNILYFMDKEDVFMFNGNSLIPLGLSKGMRTLYQAHVDNNSFIVYNKLRNEIYLILNNYIIVVHDERREYYYRKIDITPLGGFLDVDNNLILYDVNNFYLMNHDYNTFDESLEWGFTTELIDFENPNDFKKLNSIQLNSKINNKIDITAIDPNKSDSYSETEIENTGTEVSVIEKFPKYLFKGTKLTVKSHSGATDMKAYIRMLKLGVDRWR